MKYKKNNDKLVSSVLLWKSTFMKYALKSWIEAHTNKAEYFKVWSFFFLKKKERKKNTLFILATACMLTFVFAD